MPYIVDTDIFNSEWQTAAPPRSEAEVVTSCLFVAQPMRGASSPLLHNIGYIQSFDDNDDTPTRDTGESKKSGFKMHMHPQHCESCSRRDSTLLELCVRFLVREPSANAAEACVRTHLASAISSLENVGSVM